MTTVDLSGYGAQDAMDYAAARRRFERKARFQDDSSALDVLRYLVLVLDDVTVGTLDQDNTALGQTATELLELVRRRSESGRVFPQCRNLLWRIIIDCWLTAIAGSDEEKRLAVYLVGMPVTSLKNGDVEQLLRDRIAVHYPGDHHAEYLAKKCFAFLEAVSPLTRGETYHAIVMCVANRAVSRISSLLLCGMGGTFGPLHECRDGTAVGLVLEYLQEGAIGQLISTAKAARVPVPAFYELGVEWRYGVPNVTLFGVREVTYLWRISIADGASLSTIASDVESAARRAHEILSQWKERRITLQIAPLGITINLVVYWENRDFDSKSSVRIDV